MNTLELLDKKELLKKRAEEIISGAEKEVRKLNAGEQVEFDALTKEAADIDIQIRKIEEDNLTHGSLFSGIGGFDLGAEMAGINTLWNCEFEEHKRKVLKRHFHDAIQYTDVCTTVYPPYVDIISGGFPCQDISIANVSKKNWENGKVKGINGERSGLWKQ